MIVSVQPSYTDAFTYEEYPILIKHKTGVEECLDLYAQGSRELLEAIWTVERGGYINARCITREEIVASEHGAEDLV